MKQIGSFTNIWIENTRIKANRSKQLTLLIRHPSVQRFLREHPHIMRSQLDRYFPQLMQFVQENENCQRCPGLENCPNMIKGHSPTLEEYAGYLETRMKPCSKLLSKQEREKQQKLFQSLHVPAEILHSSFEDIDFYAGRMKAVDAAIEFCKKFGAGERPEKGLYLYGSLGVGKSLIAGAIANRLVEHGIDSFMVYVPDFVREVRSSIEDRTLGEKLNLFKNVSLLILDDIGAEYLTPWIRDEVLGAILHYRAAYGYPTIYTSNLTLDELEAHLAEGKNDSDEMKAKRIMERIRHFVEPISVKGPNRRIG